MNIEDIVAFMIERRKRLGLSMSKAGELAGLSQQNVSNIESGRTPRLDTLLALLKAYGCHIEIVEDGQHSNDERTEIETTKSEQSCDN